MNKIFNQNAKLFIDKATEFIYYADIYVDETKQKLDTYRYHVNIPEDIFASHLIDFQKFAFLFFIEVSKLKEYAIFNFALQEDIITEIARYFVKYHFSNEDCSYIEFPAHSEIEKINVDDICADCYFNYDTKDRLIYMNAIGPNSPCR